MHCAAAAGKVQVCTFASQVRSTGRGEGITTKRLLLAGACVLVVGAAAAAAAAATAAAATAATVWMVWQGPELKSLGCFRDCQVAACEPWRDGILRF